MTTYSTYSKSKVLAGVYNHTISLPPSDLLELYSFPLIHSIQLLWPLKQARSILLHFLFLLLFTQMSSHGAFSKPSVYKYTLSFFHFLKISQNCCHLTAAYTLLIYLFVICLPLQCT